MLRFKKLSAQVWSDENEGKVAQQIASPGVQRCVKRQVEPVYIHQKENPADV